MSTADLDTYLLANWSDLDAAAARANVVEEAVFEAINGAVSEWAHQRGWSGVFSYEGGLWLSPPEWTLKAAPRPSADAWFQLDEFDNDDDNWMLTALMGLSSGSLGFKLAQSRVPTKAWKAVVTDPKRLAAVPAFNLHAPAALVLPIALDRTAILEGASADDYTAAVEPIRAALDRLEATVKVISSWLGERGEPA